MHINLFNGKGYFSRLSFKNLNYIWGSSPVGKSGLCHKIGLTPCKSTSCPSTFGTFFYSFLISIYITVVGDTVPFSHVLRKSLAAEVHIPHVMSAHRNHGRLSYPCVVKEMLDHVFLCLVFKIWQHTRTEFFWSIPSNKEKRILSREATLLISCICVAELLAPSCTGRAACRYEVLLLL